jgi:hypothetical protein
MRKILTTMVAAATIGAATLAMSSSANAWWRGGWGWGWGLGGFAAGAIVGSALAAPYYYPYGGYGGYYGYANYGYANYGYAPYAYYGAGYYGCQRVWNGWAWVSGCY